MKRHKIKKEKFESSSQQQQHEEHDLAYYIHDRVDLMHQVFSLLKYKELKSMAPECIRNLTIGDLQELCTEELLGISSKRLLAILDGAEPPSDTESSSPSPPPDLETISLDSISSDEELLSSSSKKKKHKHKHRNSKSKTKKKDKPKESEAQLDENGELSKASRAGITVLELLELQARARAIRAQLQQDQPNRLPSETIAVETSHHSTDNEVEIKEETPDVVEISSEDEKPDVEKLQKNITEKATSQKDAESTTAKETDPQSKTVTKRVNDLIITVPQTKPTRKIKLNRNNVTVSLPNEPRNVPTATHSTSVTKPVVPEKVLVDRKLGNENSNNNNKSKKKKKDKKKKNVEKDGSDHDEITLQLSDSEKMDLFEDLDESRKNYERVSSSSEDTESSSSDSEEENVSKNTSTELAHSPINIIKNIDSIPEKTLQDPLHEIAESTSKTTSQEVILPEDTSENSTQRIQLAGRSSPNNLSGEIQIAERTPEIPDREILLAENIPKNISQQTPLVELVTSSKNMMEMIDSENNSDIVPENDNNDSNKNTDNNSKKNTDTNNQQIIDETQTLTDAVFTEIAEGVVSIDHAPLELHVEMIVAKDTSPIETNVNDNQAEKNSKESEPVSTDSISEQHATKKILVTISKEISCDGSKETRCVTAVDKTVYEECSTFNKNDTESQLEKEKEIGNSSLENIPLLSPRETMNTGKESQKCNKVAEFNKNDKESEKDLSDGELSDRQSSDVEAIDVQPEIVCISDEDNTDRKSSKKKRKKDKKSKKEKKCKKSKSDFREGADQNFYRDGDKVTVSTDSVQSTDIDHTKNDNIPPLKITSNVDTIDLDSDEAYEVMELSDDSSCYEVEGTVLSKEPTAEEIEALSARIDEIQREEVVTDEQIRQHEQMLAAKENDEQSDENVDQMSWKDRYLDSKKVKKVLTTANILNALRKKNKELKKKIEESKMKDNIETSNDDHISKDNNVEKIEEGSIGQYKTLQGSTKYVDPVQEKVEEENNDDDTIKEESVKSKTKEENVTKEMKKDAKQLLKMYKRLLKHNDMNKQKDPTKKKKKKQKKKNKKDKINNTPAETNI